jgi:uncharacterized protein (DUF302 family)
MGTAQAQGVVEHVSPLPFAETVERLICAIADAGLILFSWIDHAAGAREAGLEMPPTVVLIYGHPKGSTPIMLAAPTAALDLPLRVLIRQRDDGGVAVAFHPVAPMLSRAGVPGDLASRLEQAQRMLMAAVTPDALVVERRASDAEGPRRRCERHPRR